MNLFGVLILDFTYSAYGINNSNNIAVDPMLILFANLSS